VAKAGTTEYLDGLRLVTTNNEPAGCGPTGTAIRENRIVVVDDAYDDPSMAPWSGRLRQYGLRYVAAFPIQVTGEVWGSFQVYTAQTHFFEETGISLMTQVCEEISLALTAIYHDANRKQAEAQRRLQSSALEAAANAIVISDSKGRIEWANTAFATLTGYSVGEAVGKTFDLLRPEKHEKEVYANLWNTILAGKVWNGEVIDQRKDGSIFTDETTITPIRDSEGGITHFISVKQDITARKALEAQFLRAQRMESIGTLAGGIAHDLNNGLAPILMAVEVLKPQVGDEAGQKLLELVTSSVDHCSALVRQVLTFARGAEGRSVTINPPHLLNEIQSIIYDTFPKNIEFIANWKRGGWILTGDPTHLHQVLINLCVNARDAMPHGGTLKVSMENAVVDELYAGMNAYATAGDYVLIQVEDTGTGIPFEIRDRIFEPFFTTKEIGKGTGLGLSTTMGIVKSHGGFIDLSSETGKGSTFKVYLPANTETKAAQKGNAGGPSLPRGNGEIILLVDDEERLRTVAQSALEHFGYRVLTASNGAEAVAIYAQKREEIAIVLTDMAMPVMDGPATIAALRAVNPEVNVIASSGVALAAEVGVRHFVPKPYTAETMLAVLEQALRGD